MTSQHLQPHQAHRLVLSIRPSLAYLGRLRRRMELLGFPPDDPLMRATQRAFDAIQALHVQAHYLGCTSGVGFRRTGTTESTRARAADQPRRHVPRP